MAGAGFKTFNTGDVLTASDVNTYLMQQTVMVFASAAARTTALGANVAEGMLSYLKDTDVVEVYNGSAWVSSDDPNAIQNTIVDAKADLITATAADTPARLAVGTDGQVLTADSTTATGLKWATAATAASGLTFIHRSSFTNVATVDYDHFSSSYYNYVVVVESIKSASSSGGSESLMQLRYGSSTETGAIYNGSSWSIDRGGGTNALGYNSQTSAKLALDVGDTNGNSYVINFTQVGNASENGQFHGTGVLGDTTYGTVVFGGKAYTGRTYTGFRLLASSGNITGTVSIYGLAKS